MPKDDHDYDRDPDDPLVILQASSQNSGADDSNLIAMLKKENQRLKLRAQIQGKQAVRGKKKTKGKKKLKPAEREIVDVINTLLWRECKNITTHKKWKKAGARASLSQL